MFWVVLCEVLRNIIWFFTWLTGITCAYRGILWKQDSSPYLIQQMSQDLSLCHTSVPLAWSPICPAIKINTSCGHYNCSSQKDLRLSVSLKKICIEHKPMLPIDRQITKHTTENYLIKEPLSFTMALRTGDLKRVTLGIIMWSYKIYYLTIG